MSVGLWVGVEVVVAVSVAVSVTVSVGVNVAVGSAVSVGVIVAVAVAVDVVDGVRVGVVVGVAFVTPALFRGKGSPKKKSVALLSVSSRTLSRVGSPSIPRSRRKAIPSAMPPSALYGVPLGEGEVLLPV